MREFSDPIVLWDKEYHGAALASAALTIGGLCKKVIIPASTTYLDLTPWGSHPMLDPLWSNGTTAIITDGCETSRVKKVTDWIGQSELALKTLRVCFYDYNCGKCEKCVRTMLALYSKGILKDCATFPSEITPKLIRKTRYKGIGLAYAQENLMNLAGNPAMKREYRALKYAIRRELIRKAIRHLRSRDKVSGRR